MKTTFFRPLQNLKINSKNNQEVYILSDVKNNLSIR